MLGRVVFTGVLALACPAISVAQGIYTADLIRDLPAGGNLFALIEAAQPELTTDRFNSAGLNAGSSEKTTAFLASWSQTQYHVGDVTISSPLDGTPMLFPDLAWWSTIGVATGVMPAGTRATGLAIALAPQAPPPAWTSTVEFTGSAGALSQSSSPSRPPSIAAVGRATRAVATTGGQAMNGRLAFLLGAARSDVEGTRRGRDFTRGHTTSAFAHITFDATPLRLSQAVIWATDSALHVQGSMNTQRWRLFGGYTARWTTSNQPSSGRVSAERLVDGPVPLLVDRGGDESRAVVGTRGERAVKRHSLLFGGELERTSFASAPAFSGIVEERVNGIPAREWRYATPSLRSSRAAISVSAFVSDHIPLSQNTRAEASLQFDTVNGSAAGADSRICWLSVLPSASFRWDAGTRFRLQFMTGVSRTADQLMLGLLATGDPAAPEADVYRWNGGASSGAPLIARVGGGTIDLALKRPITDQFALGASAEPFSSWRLSVMGLARRQTRLIHLVNQGVPLSGYTTFTIPDANADYVGPADDQQLIVYNRKPETFGLDRYVLTNPDLEAATMGAVVVMSEVTTRRLLFRIGGTASASVGSGGNRGYTAIENDQSIAGELFMNPNAATYARGRLFNDRAYTIKALSIVQLPFAVKAGAIARFQDGQPFSRLVVVPELNQGAEAIQTFANGRSRFSYRSTLDLRLQKQFLVARGRLEVIAEAYNLLNMSTEVEEYVVTGPRFRETTAVQPPRTFHLGARITF